MMENLKKERWRIFIIFLSLTFFGLLMIYSSSGVYAFGSNKDPAYFFKKQLFFFIIGLLIFFVTLLFDLEFLRIYSRKILLLNFLALVMVLFWGKEAGGAKRWLSLGNFNIQPSEILKISFLLYCADYFQRKKNLIKNIKLGLFPLGIILGIICILLILQPDLGTVVFWIIWVVLFLFLMGARKKHITLIILFGIIISFFLIQMYPSRLKRITAYLNPFSDPRGSGFQLVQSQIAYGEGGIWGVGLGESRQKLFFLPALHTDFVFAIIAEEFGFLGSATFIAIFIFLFHKMSRIARSAKTDFKSGILWGTIFIFFLEIIINIGVSCGLFPTKGLPLPFISYGGSNLVVHYILLGLFFNASRLEESQSNN